MNLSYPPFYRAVILFLAIGRPFIASSQDGHPLKCADVKNGTFYYFDQKSGGQETFIRRGALQKEVIPKAKETILWDVTWLNDCSYSLKYESGAENHSAANQKFLNKHVLITEILQVTEDYLTFRTAFDKATNPTVLNDTLWKNKDNPSVEKASPTQMQTAFH